MKTKTIASLAATFFALLSAAQAQTTIAAWSFDAGGVKAAPYNNPGPSLGTGSAVVLGMTNSYNNTTASANCDVESLSGASTGSGSFSWRLRGTPGNGWSSQAPIGTQGAQFTVSTLGYYRIQAAFDLNCTAQGEANVQVEYTTDGWNTTNTAIITSPGSLGSLQTNTTSANTVLGTYVKLASSGTGWNNQIKVDLSGVPAVNNNTNFAIRIVNASTGADCKNPAGNPLNNSSGNWSLDNIVISGYSVLPVTDWTFENYSNQVAADPVIPNPLPALGAGTASALGMTTSYTFADGSQGSVSSPDCLTQAGSSSGAAGPVCWRVRGQSPGNGWNSQADIGAQGAEFDVSTINYNTILVTFDLYVTTQGEAKMQVEYTTDGVNWTNASTLLYPANPTFIQTNATPDLGGSPNTVAGTYFYETNGQNWYNGITVDLTDLPAVTNNPNFGIRIVNAATGPDCVAFNGGPYNNSSGNWRFDNVQVSGVYAGPAAPTIVADPSATVDHPFTNTFAANPAWQYAITNVTVNGVTLAPAAYDTNISGEIILTPAASALLQSSGAKTIVYRAQNFVADSVVQTIGAGVATHIALMTQPVGPSGNGGTLVVQPTVAVEDQYGNGATNPFPNVTFVATNSTDDWALGGGAAVVASNGVAAFTNLSATVNGSAAVNNAVITFTASGFGQTPNTISSASFVIGAPATPFTPGNLAAMQIDTVALNTTFSILELSPAAANQPAPINIIPISATAGTNSLRMSSSGSTGRLADSDDGTLLCFAGFLDGNALTPDETFILNRAAVTLNYTDACTVPIEYSVTVGSSQARAASTINNVDFAIADKNGIFIDSFNWASDNTRAVKSFGGTVYLMSATSPKPAVYAMSGVSPSATAVILPGISADTKAQDFYMVQSGANGGQYDTLYVLDQVNATSAVINKYSDVSGTWVASGAFTTTNGGDGLFAAPNGTGGTYLYYTTGGGGTPGNSIVRLTDASGFNSPINVTAATVLYTASQNTSIKGLAFVPQATAYAPQPVPPPTLIAASGVAAGSSFTVMLSPDNSGWRAAVTGITVNGSALPSAAYDVTQTGEIVFNAAQSPALQTAGPKIIVVSATGYSADSVVQTLNPVGGPSLGGVAMQNGQLAFSFTASTGLSFSVLATNDITAPRANWPVIGTAVEVPAGSGNYQFSDPSPATNSSRYYLLRQP